jgi:hypothetical protein
MLSREDILKAATLRMETIEVPEWGGSVTIRELSAQQLVDAGKANRNRDGFAAGHDIVASVVSETGEPLFTEADIPAIQQLGAAGILRVSKAINKLNGLGEDLEKNSKSSPPADSASA